MQDVADKAGVSRMTVSLALRNHPSIPPETRARIQAIAHELGYRANPLISALMVQRRARRLPTAPPTIAYVTAYPTRDGWRHRGRIHIDYFEGAKERAEQRGYRLELFWAREPGMTARRASAILRARNIRGLLLAPVLTARGHLSLDWSRFAVATMGFSLWRPRVHRAVPNQFQGTYTLLRRLARLGYRRIGLVIDRRVNERNNRQYTAALFDWQQRVPRARRVPPLVIERWDEPSFRRWFAKHHPDAFITQHGEIHHSTQALGLSVPREVGLVCLSVSDLPPGTAGLNPKGRVIGATAADLVIDQLERNELGLPAEPQVVMIESEWVDGRTVRSPR